jgi:hypothetical protein
VQYSLGVYDAEASDENAVEVRRPPAFDTKPFRGWTHWKWPRVPNTRATESVQHFTTCSYVLRMSAQMAAGYSRHSTSLSPIGCSWSYLACRTGRLVPMWQLSQDPCLTMAVIEVDLPTAAQLEMGP